jgi:histidine ammonia-lyase
MYKLGSVSKAAGKLLSENISSNNNNIIQIGSKNMKLCDVYKMSQNPNIKIGLNKKDDLFINTLAQSRQHLENKVSNYYHNLKHNPSLAESIYGVTTCVGEACTQLIENENQIETFQTNLVESHQIGFNDLIYNSDEIRSMLFVRLIQITRGYSGVSFNLLNTLISMINYNVLPCIPQQGSLSASGDLIPLSYIAGCINGSKSTNIIHNNIKMTSYDFWNNIGMKKYGISNHKLGAKEGLAIMNGTSVGCALLILQLYKIESLINISCVVSGMCSNVTGGNPFHFDSRIHESKPFNGQMYYAKMLELFHNHLNKDEFKGITNRCQQRYSTRCSPHIIGILLDSLDSYILDFIGTELNSATDNPLIDPKTGDIMHGGNFYGGHLGFASDSLKQLIGNMIDMHDRQLMQLFDPTINNNLGQDLKYTNKNGLKENSNHLVGFKPFGLESSSLTAEALQMVQPMNIFSRSSESHNQDKVPMATISVRQLKNMINIAQKILSLNLVALAQAVDIRLEQQYGMNNRSGNNGNNGNNSEVPLHPRSVLVRNYLRNELKIPFINEKDHSLSESLNKLLIEIQNGKFEKFLENNIFPKELENENENGNNKKIMANDL